MDAVFGLVQIATLKFILSKENFLVVVVVAGRELRCSPAVLLLPKHPICGVSFLFLSSFLQAGPGSSADWGLPQPSSLSPCILLPLPCSFEFRGVASYGSTFHLVQLQPLATSTPAADFKTFYNNFCFSCRHFSIFVFQSSPPSLVLIVMML